MCYNSARHIKKGGGAVDGKGYLAKLRSQSKRERIFAGMGLTCSGRDLAIAFGLYLAAVMLCLFLRNIDLHQDTTYVAVIFLLDVFLTAYWTNGYVLGIITAVAGVFSVDYIFTYPYWHISFTLTGFPLTFLVMMTISVLTAAVSVPHNIGAGRIKGVWRIPTGKGQLVNVFAGQPAPLEIFTSAGVQRGFIAFPAGSEDFSGSGGGVIAADRDILEHGPVKAKILTVGAVDRHVPGAKTGAVKIVDNGGGRGNSRNRFRGGGFAWCCNRCLRGRLRCPPALQECNSE